jgi:hypothetical protein
VIVDEDGEELDRQFMTRPSKFVQRYWSLFASNQSLFLSEEAADAVFPLDESLEYTMDAELTWNLLSRGHDFRHVPAFLGAFRVQDGAKTFADVSAPIRTELDRIYDHPWFESVLPRQFLTRAGQAAKYCLLLLDGRTDAFKYNAKALLT